MKLIVLFLFLSIGACAQECTNVYRYFLEGQTLDIISDFDLNRTYRKNITQTISKGNSLLKRADMLFAGRFFEIVIDEVNTPEALSYGPEGMFVRVPIVVGESLPSFLRIKYGKKEAKEKFYSMHPNALLSSLSHEYGHGVLMANMFHDLPWLQGVMKKIEEITDRYNQKDEELDSLLEKIEEKIFLINEDHNTQKTDELEILLAKHEEYASLKENLVEEEEKELFSVGFSMRDGVTGAFHELFADFLSVLITGKIRTYHKVTFTGHMRKVMNFEGFEDEHKLRDFTNKKNCLSKWDGCSNIHTMMAPVRYHLYENYMKKPLFNREENKAKILRALYDTLIEEINFYWENKGVEFSVDDVNKGVIKKIDAKVKARNWH